MIGAAGLAPDMPARHHGCPANDLPTRRSTLQCDTAWPDKSLPSALEWPITGLPAPSRKLMLDKHRSIDLVPTGHPERFLTRAYFAPLASSHEYIHRAMHPDDDAFAEAEPNDLAEPPRS